MRCDQYVGLNTWSAEKVLAKQTVQDYTMRLFPDGRVETFECELEVVLAYPTEKIGVIAGAFQDHVACLRRFILPTGEIFDEFVQCEPWSSGPMYFIALKDVNGDVVPESLWTDREIQIEVDGWCGDCGEEYCSCFAHRDEGGCGCGKEYCLYCAYDDYFETESDEDSAVGDC